MLVLSLGCYLIRALRWGALLRLEGYPVRARDSIYLHFSGQTMSVSPGRVGEVLKPWLSTHVAGMPMSRGIGLIFAERVADLIAVVVLSLGGLAAMKTGGWTLPLALVLVVGGTAVGASDWFHERALLVLARHRWVRKHEASLGSLSIAIRRALSWRTLAWSVPASIVAWGLEGVGFYLCVRALGFDGLTAVESISVYSISTFVGALSFMPGGIGLTEASMAGLLVAVGMSASAASAATLITRVATLWWAVALGWLMLLTRARLFRELISSVPESAE